MYPQGIIYQSQDVVSKKGVVSLQAPLLTRFIYALFQTIGIFLLLFGFLYVGFIFGPVVKAEVDYKVDQVTQEPSVMAEEVEPSKNDFEEALGTIKIQEQAKEFGVDPHFAVVVPKIKAYSNIASNVDPANEKQYFEVLEKSVAHAKGTNFPGEGKLIYLFSHSTNSSWSAIRMNATFYLLNKLTQGDKIIIFFADKKYEYEVSETVIVGPKDTSWIKDKAEGEMLILQTCTPAGTSLRRLLVIAKPAEEKEKQ